MFVVVKHTCIVCGKTSTVSDFPRYRDRKGNWAYLNTCKDCKSLYKKQHYESHKEDYLKRSKSQRERDPDGYKEYLHKYYRDNRELLLEKNKQYNKSHSEQRKEYLKRYRSIEDTKIKIKARSMLNHAVQNGLIERPDSCECCGKKCVPEAHHDNYNKPYEVIWLCKNCHENEHHLNEEYSSGE